MSDLIERADSDALASAAAYAAAEKSENTRRSYRADIEAFVAWCESVGRRALPAEPATCVAFLAHCADCGYCVSTIQRRAAAIAYAHKLADMPSPLQSGAARSVMRGIRRTLGVAQTGKAPLTADLVARVVRRLPNNVSGLRDRALLLIGFATALRRAELVALDFADIERSAEGVFVHVRRSKTDQEGEGARIAVPFGRKLKPVDALDAWLALLRERGVTEGAIFRRVWRYGDIGGRLTDQSVAALVKRAAARAKLDPAIFGGHSLRAGFVTSALSDSADLFRVMDVTRHCEVKTLRVYDRHAKAFKDHAGGGFL